MMQFVCCTRSPSWKICNNRCLPGHLTWRSIAPSQLHCRGHPQNALCLTVAQRVFEGCFRTASIFIRGRQVIRSKRRFRTTEAINNRWRVIRHPGNLDALFKTIRNIASSEKLYRIAYARNFAVLESTFATRTLFFLHVYVTWTCCRAGNAFKNCDCLAHSNTVANYSNNVKVTLSLVGIFLR